MSIIVNGIPTELICIEKLLKQGDPLAPFLFLTMAERFSGLMKNAVDKALFSSFKLGNEEAVISRLQYEDDTLCIGNQPWKTS